MIHSLKYKGLIDIDGLHGSMWMLDIIFILSKTFADEYKLFNFIDHLRPRATMLSSHDSTFNAKMT